MLNLECLQVTFTQTIDERGRDGLDQVEQHFLHLVQHGFLVSETEDCARWLEGQRVSNEDGENFPKCDAQLVWLCVLDVCRANDFRKVVLDLTLIVDLVVQCCDWELSI